MAAEQELKIAEKAREHQVELETEIKVEKQKAAELEGNRSLSQVDCSEGSRRTKNMTWSQRSRRLSRLRRKLSLQLRLLTRRTNCTQQRKQDNEQQASYAKEYVAKVEAELQKICDGILALMDKNFIPIGQKDCRSRRPSTKDAQEIIQF